MSEIAIPLGKKLLSPQSALPLVMLERMLRDKDRVALETGKVSVIIKVPTSDWVTPTVSAAKILGEWNEVVAPSGRPILREDFDSALKQIATGGRVLSVSVAPETDLPASIRVTADLVSEMPAPSREDIQAVVRAVTGLPSPDLPANVGRDLDFPTLCSSMRTGSTPEQCAHRLAAALKAAERPDPTLAAIPYLHELRGYGKAMDWATGLVADLERWRSGDLSFSALQKSCVLVSAPGLGKTNLVASLAKTAGLPLFASSVGTWFATGKGDLDGVVKQMDQLFRKAAAAGPSVVFLDELEGVPDRRNLDSKNRDWWTPVVGHLLTILDGAASATSNVIVVGATNYPDLLDEALIRPGRLDRLIRIEAPDAHSLEHIFRQYLGDSLPHLDISHIAKLCVGMSGAAVAGMVKDARAAARAAGRSEIETCDLMALAIPESSEDRAILRRISVHEAGHAVIAHVLGAGRVDRVTTIRSNGSGGKTNIAMPNGVLTRAELFDQARIGLGGIAAEKVLLGESSTAGGGSGRSDLARVTHILASCKLSYGFAESMVYVTGVDEVEGALKKTPSIQADVDRELKRLFSEVCGLVEERRSKIESLATALETERVVDGRRFLEILADTEKPGGMHVRHL